MEQKVYEIEPKSLKEIYGAKYHIGPEWLMITMTAEASVVIVNNCNHWLNRPYWGEIG